MRARENPFRSECIERLPFRTEGITVEGLMDRALALRACALVGPEGSGKTTLIETLSEQFGRRGFRVKLLRVCPESAISGMADPPGGEGRRTLLLDGLESAGRRARPLLRKLADGADLLVATAHRPGFLPTLLELRTSPALLAELVGELVGEEETGGLNSELPGLFERHGGNIRECFRELYNRWSEKTLGY